MSEIRVSINCPTYNHANYLNQCIEGFLMQETNFEFEINICDDCSPDKTTEIVTKYINEHPRGYRIKYYRQKENVGMMQNGLFGLSKCTSKYTALCEGDDYWTDPYKLQKQVDFLEANNDYALCFHPVNVLSPNGETQQIDLTENLLFERGTSDKVDLALYGNYIHTPSVVFKNCIKEFPENFEECPLGDIYLFMLIAQKGKLKNLNESMAVYRSNVGIHSKQNEQVRIQNTVTTFNKIAESIDDSDVRRILVLRVAAYLYELKNVEFDKLTQQINYPSFLVSSTTAKSLLQALWLKLLTKLSIQKSKRV